MRIVQNHPIWAAIAAASLGCLAIAVWERAHFFGGVALASAGSHESAPAAGDSEALAVQTILPARKDLVVKFEQAGPIEGTAQADLYTEATGYVKKVHVDIGDKVEAGQVLLEVDVPNLVQQLAYKEALVHQAEAEYEQAESAVQAANAALTAHPAHLEEAQADVKKAEAEQEFCKQQAERYGRLASADATTRELAEEKRKQLGAATAACDSSRAKQKAVEVDKAVLTAKLDAAKADQRTRATKVGVAKADREKTRVELKFAKLKAPFDGVITRRTVDEGAFVNSAASGRGDPIFTICSAKQVTVVLRVPEKEASAVRIGNRALIQLAALGGQQFEGRVARFSHALEEKSRTMRVEIDIDNDTGALYPGMYGPITLILQEIKQALTVPASAVYAVGAESFVIQVDDGKSHRRLVKTGYDDGRVVQITSGLEGDEEIVVSNKGQIAEGQSLDPHRNGDEAAAGSGKGS